MRVCRAKHIGYCFGVRRAVEMALKRLGEDGPPVYTLGPLMHNPQEVRRLEELGIKDLGDRPLAELAGKKLLLRSHGVEAQLVTEAQAHGIIVLDATCPHVKLPRKNIVEFGKQGRHVLLMGDPDHAEIKAQLSYAAGKVSVIRKPEDLPDLPRNMPVALVAQTTLISKHFEAMVLEVRRRFDDVVVADTICVETGRRQAECLELARLCDAVVVVGGRNSANTLRLAELAREVQPNTYHVENAKELTFPLPGNPETVALVSGASTPDWIIAEVEQALDPELK